MNSPAGGTGQAAGGGLATRAAVAFAAYRDGDEQRMDELVGLLTPVLWRVARGAGATRRDAADAVQVAWLRLVDNAASIRDPQAVLGWLMTTLRREVISRGRRREALPVDTAAHEHDRADTAPGPAAVAELTERQQALWAHVHELDERCQYLLQVIAFAQRPDYATIAAHLDMPTGSIGPTRGRCLDKLRQRLQADARWED